MGRTSRAVIPGSRLFNALFGFPRVGKNFSWSLDTIQSGSPPGAHPPGPLGVKAQRTVSCLPNPGENI
jgi:hypothetical protein